MNVNLCMIGVRIVFIVMMLSILKYVVVYTLSTFLGKNLNVRNVLNSMYDLSRGNFCVFFLVMIFFEFLFVGCMFWYVLVMMFSVFMVMIWVLGLMIVMVGVSV